MKVFVNDKPLIIFRGARVRDAVWRYNRRYDEMIKFEEVDVKDRWGNIIAEDAPLMENTKIYIFTIMNDCE
ncbi:MAG: hypothetical protein PHR20_02890 [Bacteroidales bacterium]|nr:hypothetical protein [Bacteroidales bacterium]